MNDDWSKGGVEVTSQTVSFGKPGDFIKGTYTSKKYVESKENWLYELKGDVGQFHPLDENKAPVDKPTMVDKGEYYQVWGGKSAIDDLFKKARFGEIVAVKFHEAVPSKTKGNAPFKVFKTLTFGTDPEYMGETAEALQAAFPGAEEL